MIELWNGQPVDWQLTLVPGGEFLDLRPLSPARGHGLAVHLGGEGQPVAGEIRRAAAKVVKRALEMGARSMVLEAPSLPGALGREGIAALAEGAGLALFRPDQWKTGGREEEAVSLYLNCGDTEGCGPVLAEARSLVEAVCFARNLVNAPANRLTPEDMARRMAEAAGERGIEAEVLDEAAIGALGMEAFLTVGRSAGHPPRLIVLRYSGAPDSAGRIALVGKGVTCDTGGYNLKPSAFLRGIRGDMAGGAAVCGALLALAENRVRVNAVAVIPAAENRISPDSYLPGDVIGSMAGKTIEIRNTDAEGRLLLADAITYAIRREGATRVLDIATLTGAVVDMLGFTTAGLLSNSDEFCAALDRAAERSGEQHWRMPAFSEYAKLIESPVADLSNLSSGGCGAITAGLFLRAFCEELPWIHLDIAGTAWVDKPVWEFQSKGATGAGVTTLYYLCRELAEGGSR